MINYTDISLNLLKVWNLCDYSDSYILVKETIRVRQAVTSDRHIRRLIFLNCAPFNNYISEIISTQVDNAENRDIVIQCITILLDSW